MTTRDITTRPTGHKKITDDEAIVLAQKELRRYLSLRQYGRWHRLVRSN